MSYPEIGVIHKPCGHIRGRGVCQLYIFVTVSALFCKWSTRKERKVKNNSQRGLWMTLSEIPITSSLIELSHVRTTSQTFCTKMTFFHLFSLYFRSKQYLVQKIGSIHSLFVKFCAYLFRQLSEISRNKHRKNDCKKDNCLGMSRYEFKI